MKFRPVILLIIFGLIIMLLVRSLHRKSEDNKILESARTLHQSDIDKEIRGCENGYAPACMTMGKIYKNGYYFQDQSTTKAATYFEKGCNYDAEFEESCTLLGDLVSANNSISLTSMTKKELYMKICKLNDKSSRYCDLAEKME